MARDGFQWWRKDKRCWFVWLEGRQIRLHEDKTEAIRRWHQIAVESATAPAVSPGGPTVAGTIDAYLIEAQTRLKPSTMPSKRKILLRLKAAHGMLLAAK